MKKLVLLTLALMLGYSAMAQSTDKATKAQYLLIVRFKADFVPPSKAAIDSNIAHWNIYMGGLARSGKLVTGYRPGNDGQTFSGTDKTAKTGFYVANDELVSSFIIISAASMDEADNIAKACPVFEFGGSVEVRSLMQTAN